MDTRKILRMARRIWVDDEFRSLGRGLVRWESGHAGNATVKLSDVARAIRTARAEAQEAQEEQEAQEARLSSL